MQRTIRKQTAGDPSSRYRQNGNENGGTVIAAPPTRRSAGNAQARGTKRSKEQTQRNKRTQRGAMNATKNANEET
jgi:hypothetical protein